MTALLVDGSNLLMRAVHAMQGSGLASDAGVPTGALLVFINCLSRHVAEEQPTSLVVCWDGKSEFRRDLDPGYKANRTAAPPIGKEESKELVVRFLEAAGVPQASLSTWEADDLIAHYWRTHEPIEDRIVILSSDKDFLQLLSPGVEQVRLSSADTPTDRWDARRVIKNMGCDPLDLPAAMALAGDASDNVIGVPRVGMKTAIKLLSKHNWDLDAALELEPKLQPHVEQVRKNFRLVNLQNPEVTPPLGRTPDFEPVQPGGPGNDEMEEFFRRYQLSSVWGRWRARQLWGSLPVKVW